MAFVLWLTFGKHYSATACTIGECRSDGRRVVLGAVGRGVFRTNGAYLANSRVLSKDSRSTNTNGKE